MGTKPPEAVREAGPCTAKKPLLHHARISPSISSSHRASLRLHDSGRCARLPPEEPPHILEPKSERASKRKPQPLAISVWIDDGQGDFDLSNFEDGCLSSAFMVGLLVASPIFASLAKRWEVIPIGVLHSGEAILMLPFAILGFVMKPLQLKGFMPAESKRSADRGWRQGVSEVQGDILQHTQYLQTGELCNKKIKDQISRFTKDMKVLLIEKVYVVNVLASFSSYAFGAIFCFSAFCFSNMYAFLALFAVGELLVFATQDCINNWRVTAAYSNIYIHSSSWYMVYSVDRFNEESENQISTTERSSITPLLEGTKTETTESAAEP
ncbi:hypothetical protein J5N97_002050 [Dioscorea zingiberensis]|uniref:Uncharacterized protein n=1 Tax=Dioscorea zingiberensis TaxID=325984 RepID=A0A9D5H1V7_9LILI|nr:hypothetical protein J5N97_002050 [Dioscorea zingiberensis]